MLKLKLQYFGHLMGRTNSLLKTLILGKTEANGTKGRQKMRWLNSITDSMDMNLSRLRETVEDRGVLRAIVHGSFLDSPLDCKEIQPLHPKGNQI